ncbi:hypothetical protein MKQ70_16060 [Chitinophaga sedimenti]|uniref:hypothetical protein n=1 Tax=Chitinophaga sedimenti TaxID=2033606 RepID=UPI002003F28F|nr:hypothetical protein [Chitinophaga sedimenti]MCK7556448.1 hypothetical protein [Chitinophaga sedimenti]
MIQQGFNAISSGASGQFGKQVVVYYRYGKQIIAKAPRKRPGRGTDAQERTKANFRGGALWSAKVRKSALLHATYKAGLHGSLNVHNLAIADFLQAPVIHGVEIGDSGIVVMATDNFKVAMVTVRLYSRNGELVEKGAAVQEDDERWLFVPGKKQLDGCRVVVSVKDLPGNETVREMVMEGESVMYPPAVNAMVVSDNIADDHRHHPV